MAVLGLARSGVALTRFLCDRGARVTVYDARPSAELGNQIDQLEGRPVRLLLGPAVDPSTALAEQALIATSPSINSRYPTTEPRMREALAEVEADGRIPVVSEVDLFLRLCPATTIGVTGTKGKTTTSSLIAAVLAKGSAPSTAGTSARLSLNGYPSPRPNISSWWSCPSFQLPGISRGTDIAVYTHVTSDHLDRHGTVEAYRAAKRRLAELVPSQGRTILNAEDPVSSSFASASAAPPLFYRREEPLPGGVGVRGDWIVADLLERLDSVGGGVAATEPTAASCRSVRCRSRRPQHEQRPRGGCCRPALRHRARRYPAGGRRFPRVEHRLERVATIGGVTLVNDSQGTQPDAVIASCAFAPPIVLIMCGRTKNVPLHDLADVVAERAAAAVLIGETADEMAGLFAHAGLEHMGSVPPT